MDGKKIRFAFDMGVKNFVKWIHLLIFAMDRVWDTFGNK
jgi:hypothetical protein